MTTGTHLVVGFVTILSVLSASCGETTSESRGAPPELQTVDEFIGWADIDEGAGRRAQFGLQGRIDGKLVECMAGRGLEYAPYEGPTGERPLLGEGLSDSEFRLQYGYGVFTGMLDDARWNTEGQDFEGLEPDEWYWAFADDPDYMAELDECTVQVENELGRPDPGFVETLAASLDEAWDPLNSELEAMPQRIAKDSRYVEAEKAWSACMDDKGFDFATEEDIDAYLMAKLDAFEAEANLGTVLLTEPFERDIQPFVDEEMAIAAADVACRAELDRLRKGIQREYEGWFIDDHRDELEKIRELEQQLMEVILEGWQW